MANNNRFILTGPSGSLTADDTTILVGSGSIGEPMPATMQKWSDLQALINSTNDGETLDLTGQGFEPDLPDNSYYVRCDKSITFKGGYITGSIPAVWQIHDSQTGTYVAEFYDPNDSDGNLSNWLVDWRNYLVDDGQAEQPVLKVTPNVPPAFDRYRLSRNPNWYNIKDSTTALAVIRTADGDNATGSAITGFRFIDTSIIDAVDAQVTAAGGISSTGFIYLASDNRTAFAAASAWDSITGELTFSEPGITYQGYVSFAMLGGKDLEAGEYSYDAPNNKVYYRPVNGDPSKCRVPYKPEIMALGNSGADTTVTFEGSTICGASLNPIGNVGNIKKAADYNLVMRDCHIHTGKNGIYNGVAIDIERCVVERIERYGIQCAGENCLIVNCVVKDTESSSAIYASAAHHPTVAMAPFEVRNCLLHTPASGHGQGITLGNDVWQQATIENNIFYNCSRAFAFQPAKTLSNRCTVPGTFKFNNNMVLTTSSVYGDFPSGQAMIAFNGAADDHLLGLDQLAEFRHNTVFCDEDTVPGDNQAVAWTLSIGKLEKSTVTLDSNICAMILVPVQGNGNNPQERFANLQLHTEAGSNPGWGSSDLATPNELSDVFNKDTFTTTGVASTAASDGGVIGVRYNNIPTEDQIEIFSVDWSSTFIPETLPAPPVSYSETYGGDDNR